MTDAAEQVAEKLGISRSYVFYQRKIADNPEIQAAVKKGILPLYMARRLVEFTPRQQKYVLAGVDKKDVRERYQEVMPSKKVDKYETLVRAWNRCTDHEKLQFLNAIGR